MEDLPPLPTRERIAVANPNLAAHEVEDMYQRFKTQDEAAQTAGSWVTGGTPTNEILQEVQTFAPDPNSPNLAFDTELYNKMSTQAANIIKDRNTNPADHALRYSVDLKNMQSSARTPDEKKAFRAALVQRQRDLGIPEDKLQAFIGSEVKAMEGIIDHPEMTAEQKLDSAFGLLTSAGDDMATRHAMINQLRDQGVDGGFVELLEVYSTRPGDAIEAFQAWSDTRVSKSKSGGVKTDTREAVRATYFGADQRGGIKYGGIGGTQLSKARQESAIDLVSRVATSYINQNYDAGAAIKLAGDKVLGTSEKFAAWTARVGADLEGDPRGQILGELGGEDTARWERNLAFTEIRVVPFDGYTREETGQAVNAKSPMILQRALASMKSLAETQLSQIEGATMEAREKEPGLRGMGRRIFPPGRKEFYRERGKIYMDAMMAGAQIKNLGDGVGVFISSTQSWLKDPTTGRAFMVPADEIMGVKNQ